jgi:transmembrane protein 173
MSDPNTERSKGFGQVYKPRGSRSAQACILVLVLYVIFNFFIERRYENLSPWYFYEFALGVSFLVLLMGEVIRRICLFAEEHRHIDSRYGGSWKKAFQTTFEFNNNKLIGILTAIALLMVAHIFLSGREWTSFTSHDLYVLFFLNVVFIPVFVYVFGLREPLKVEYSQMDEKQNKNLADGLAWSYYFGYLEFILPELTTQINLTGRYLDKIKVKKVFIILPQNCQVHDTISDPRGLVHDVGNLEPLKIDRGGIRERRYEHTVYRITDERAGEEHYCIMEYATPLQILHEMSNDPNAGLSREERDYQVVAFYNKVKEILDRDQKCKGKYELITVSGQDDDIGRIMVNLLTNPAIEI